MIKPGPAFDRPQTPAAKCLHLVRLNPIITRSELVEATGLSQPTITRAIAALLEVGLVHERSDLTRTRGRGRPTVPLEVADNSWMLAGIAVGTSSTYIALYDAKGRTIREADVDTPVAKLSEDDFIEHIMAGVNRLSAGLDRRLVSVGVTTSGTVTEDGLVYAQNLGWDGVDVPARLGYQFGVPVVVSSAIPAILGSETQAADLSDTAPTLVLFADDSIGAALSTRIGVRQIIPLPEISSELLGAGASEELLTTSGVLAALGRQGVEAASIAEAADAPSAREVLDERARQLGTITAQLVAEHQPATVVVAGSAFLDDAAAPKLFASTVRAAVREAGGDVSALGLRMIPTHREVVRAVARAVAMDPLLRIPLALGKDSVKA